MPPRYDFRLEDLRAFHLVRAIDHLTAPGVMDPRLLYESPFTDLDPLGVAGIFAEGEVVQLIQILREVDGRAAA